MSRNSIKILLVSLCVLLSVQMFSQTRQNSPYSIFGIGILNDYSNPVTFAMGGVQLAFQDPASLSPANPASFGALVEKSFVFDASMIMNSSKLSATGMSDKGSFASLNALLFGFPISPKWKASFGLVPYSDVGYNINRYEIVEGGDEINHLNTGDGGINKVYFAQAFNITKNFTFGVETGLYFGKIEHDYMMLFGDTYLGFHNRHLGFNKYSDAYIKFGAQYNIELKEDLQLTLGAIYTPKAKINTDSTSSTQLIQTPFDEMINIVEVMDEQSFDGKTNLPTEIGFGLMFTKKNKWKLGFDFEQQFWSKFTALDKESNLRNSTRFAIGAEYIPDRNNVFKYYKRIKYRVGFRYEQTPLYINGNHIKEFGISFGMGLPLKRSLSTINLGVEIGQTGKTADNLIKDSFFTFKLGVSMFQRWFEQRKYY